MEQTVLRIFLGHRHTLMLLMCSTPSRALFLLSKCRRTESLLYNRPKSHATIGGRRSSCEIWQYFHLAAVSASLSFCGRKMKYQSFVRSKSREKGSFKTTNFWPKKTQQIENVLTCCGFFLSLTSSTRRGIVPPSFPMVSMIWSIGSKKQRKMDLK